MQKHKHEVLVEFFDWIKVLTLMFTLLFVSLLVVYSIMKNYVDVDSFLAGNLNKKTVYILDSVDNEKYLPYLKSHIKKFNVSVIKEGALANMDKIKKNSILLLLDARNIHQKTKILVQEYVHKGGAVVFNFADDDLVRNITDLNLKNRGVLQKGEFVIQSPVLSNVQTKKEKIKLYDNIFLYDKKSALDLTKDYKSYGILWYGSLAKGRWVYSSVPFYVLKNANVLNDVIEYLYYGFKAEKFPYLDVENPVLINEYLYYKFDYNVVNLINNLHLKATLFVNPEKIDKELKVGSNIEIASTVADEKIVGKLYKYTKQHIIGFANEDANLSKKVLIGLYKDQNFLYTFNKEELNNHIYYDDFVEFSQSGYNDKSLLDDVEEIKKIIDFKTRYGLFVFTIHSYLLGYTQNLNTLDEILKHLQNYNVITASQARHKYLVSSKIFYSFDRIENGIIMKVKNNSLEDVKNLTFRIYSRQKFTKMESNLLNIEAKIINQHDDYFDVRIGFIKKNAEFFLRIKK